VGVLPIALVLACVLLRPQSLTNGGGGVLAADLALMLVAAALGAWARRERRAAFASAFRAGDAAGLALGALLAARHAAESFLELGSSAALVLGVGLVFSMLASFATAGSLVREATRSTALGVLAALWTSALALQILLGVAFACILAWPDAIAARFDAPFRASGMSDPRAYLVRNGLDSALELLTRMPVFALFAAGGGAIAQALIERIPRVAQRGLAWLAPCVLVGGGWMLYHADGLARSARPPLVMAGVALVAAALCSAHPIWSALRATSASSAKASSAA
jgi:hypothetical protein